MRIVAVIPVKENSERVKSKNFKVFADDISLLELKINHLLDAEIFDEIYISSDSKTAEKLASKYDIKFISRSKSFCNNDTSWSDVIYEVVSSLPESEDTSVAWCHTTSPLFENYQKSVDVYKKAIKEKTYNGLVSVTQLTEFIVSEGARPVNYNWGVWHEYSQNLDKLYAITGALFITTKSEMLKNRYVMATNPYLFEVSSYESIDIDTVYDFNLAQIMYLNKEKF